MCVHKVPFHFHALLGGGMVHVKRVESYLKAVRKSARRVVPRDMQEQGETTPAPAPSNPLITRY